jgi:hypothetical protein
VYEERLAFGLGDGGAACANRLCGNDVGIGHAEGGYLSGDGCGPRVPAGIPSKVLP